MKPLDEKNRKILAILDEDARMPFSQLAKRVRLSREVVDYRIKEMQKAGIIKGYFLELGLTKLGLQGFRLCLRFQNYSGQKEKEVHDYLSSLPQSVFIESCTGTWDMVIGISAPNAFAFEKTVVGFLDKFSKIILRKEILTMLQLEVYNKKWLLDSPKITRHAKEIEEPGDSIKIDKVDKEILTLLSTNARMATSDIARAAGASSPAIAARIRNLKNKGVIAAFRVAIDSTKLGRQNFHAFVYLNTKKEAQLRSFLTYVKQHPAITNWFKMLGSWDVELEFELADLQDFNKIMMDMKNKFDFIKNYESVFVTKIIGPTFLP